jgi:glycerol-3-phosphate dehydrogenase (NAD(P)+)
MSQAAPTPPDTTDEEIVVLGAGAWGTTLALLLARNGHRVRLWCRRHDLADALNRHRENRRYLPGHALTDPIVVNPDLSAACDGVGVAVLAVPTQGVRALLERLPPIPALISGTKGLEVAGFRRVSEIVAEAQPDATIATLSGPNLAGEIAAGKPAAATVACPDDTFTERAQQLFQQPPFRVYRSRDQIGVEIAGAMKNVVALAAGMVDGLDLGANARATIITRGLAEIARVGLALGGEARTFYGLAGLGDLVATCASRSSRNHTAGERFAHGARLADIERSNLTAEGIPTAKAAYVFAGERGLDLPISSEVYRVVFEEKAPEQAVRDLMGRSAHAE